tara:strand:+ start:264 stop:656 length:393 start_codon:yes stop_codon:yes gene_type:complete
MDVFIRNRLKDKRFDSRPVRTSGRPQVAWFEQPRRSNEESDFLLTRHYASATTHDKEHDKKHEPLKKKKQKKHNKGDGDGTSDGSDSPCWSDYERVPGTKEGEKGSCRPEGSGDKGEKKSKKRKKKAESD